MNWQERFHEFLAGWLRDVRNLPVIKVTGVYTEPYEWFDYSDAHGVSIHLEIYWVDDNGQNHIENFDGGIEEIFWRS